jgi:hypothetical protein
MPLLPVWHLYARRFQLGWTLHPDGYYIPGFPLVMQYTKYRLYVPKTLLVTGKQIVYNATNDIACPTVMGSQRLAQTNEPLNQLHCGVKSVKWKHDLANTVG